MFAFSGTFIRDLELFRGYLGSVCKKVHTDILLRTLPGLGEWDIDLSDDRVGNDYSPVLLSRSAELYTFSVRGYCIGADLDILESSGPVAACELDRITCRFSILEKADSYCLCSFRNVGRCYGVISFLCDFSGVFIRYRCLICCVFHICRKTCPGMLPFIAPVKRYRIADSCVAGLKLHLNACRTLFALVVIIVPDLLY